MSQPSTFRVPPQFSAFSPSPSQPTSEPPNTSTQCRLRRIQSREHCAEHRTDPPPLPSHLSICSSTPPSGSEAFVGVTHQKAEDRTACGVGAESFFVSPAPAALADSESVSDSSLSFLFPSATDLATSPQPTYPFPPPGLSKPSTPPSQMIVPEHESSSCTPRELELKSNLLFTPPSAVQLSSSEPDGSVWSAFRLESFLGNYCHASNTSKALNPSPSFHSYNEDGTETEFDLPPASLTLQPNPVLSPAHRNRLKDDIAMTLNTTSIPTLHPSSSQHSPSSPLSTLNARHASPLPVNPFMVHRQRQQAFISHWNCVRQRNRHAPAMPSFFNPARGEAPRCSWIFLRDPTCGGDVNGRLSARRGRESIFEKALVKLPLTRCRSSCDRIRRDQQNLLGWGVHAWISPSKHCHYCVNDELIKGFLMFRSYENEKNEEEMRRRREQQERPILFMDADEADEGTIDSDAVLLSFPYRTSSPQDHQDQIQKMPTEPFVNYNEIEPTSHTYTSRVPLKGQGNQSDPDPKDVSVWGAELEKRLLASPVIRDLDDFDLEDLEGFDDEDLDGYYDSDEEEEEEDEDEQGYSSSGSSSPTSDACECDAESGCRCPRIVVGEVDVDDKSSEVDVIQEVAKDTTPDLIKTKSNSGKGTTAICGKVLMSFWEEDDLDGVDCVHVEVEQVAGCVEADDLGINMGMGVGVGAGMVEEEKWMVNDMKVLEVQVQA